MATRKTYRHHILDYLAYALMILCFPLNPLVLLHLIEPREVRFLTYLGFLIWFVGMVLVIYPFIYFRSKGQVKKGKAYVHTQKLVRSGLYAVIRHVQYTGGIISIFIATPFIYPHWVFLVMGIPGIWLTYLGSRREDQFLVEKFGEAYSEYMEQVPAMNIFIGIIRILKRK